MTRDSSLLWSRWCCTLERKVRKVELLEGAGRRGRGDASAAASSDATSAVSSSNDDSIRGEERWKSSRTRWKGSLVQVFSFY